MTKFNSNRDLDALIKDGWLREESCDNLIVAVLDRIRREMDRVYWNKNQKEMISPFDNTSATYENDVFVVRAYNWDENTMPNFDSENIKVYWYKYSGRGVSVLVKPGINVLPAINEMLNDAIECIRKEEEDDVE